jgi:hypothetical protein
MVTRLCRSAAALAAVVVVGFAAGPARGQGAPDHPTLRAALHELREARKHLKEARDVWPPGYKDRAEASIQSAIESLRQILKVENVDNFRGVSRNPDYYTRYKDHPRLRAAVQDLRQARIELQPDTTTDFGGLKDRAMDDIDIAVGDILTLIRAGKR